MCGRLSQYHGIHDFVDALSMPYPLANNAGDQPLERYNVAPTTRVALLRVEDGMLHADLVRWGWRPHWAKDRAAPINARVEKVAHGPFFRAIWPHRAIVPIDSWFEWVDEGGPKKQPYLIKRRDGRPSLCAGIGQFSAGAGQSGAEADEHDGFVIITLTAQAGWSMCTIDDQWSLLRTWLGTGWTRPCPRSRQSRWLSTWESLRTYSSGTR